jgi:hypothetical protein
LILYVNNTSIYLQPRIPLLSNHLSWAIEFLSAWMCIRFEVLFSIWMRHNDGVDVSFNLVVLSIVFSLYGKILMGVILSLEISIQARKIGVGMENL